MRKMVAILGADGLMSPEGETISRPVAAPQSRAVAVPAPPQKIVQLDPIDEIASLLARTIHLAQTLDEDDARRARALLHAASAALSASTYLPKSDQARFNAALRNSRN